MFWSVFPWWVSNFQPSKENLIFFLSPYEGNVFFFLLILDWYFLCFSRPCSVLHPLTASYIVMLLFFVCMCACVRACVWCFSQSNESFIFSKLLMIPEGHLWTPTHLPGLRTKCVWVSAIRTHITDVLITTRKSLVSVTTQRTDIRPSLFACVCWGWREGEEVRLQGVRGSHSCQKGIRLYDSLLIITQLALIRSQSLTSDNHLWIGWDVALSFVIK